MVALVQARMGSSRLPGKMARILPNGKSLLEVVLIKLVSNGCDPILVTTNNSEDRQLKDIAKKLGIYSFGGDEENVLNRFIQASKHFRIPENEFILRVCADNPFLSETLIKQTIEISASEDGSNFDYISFGFNNIPGIKLHAGIFVEAVKIGALMKISKFNNLYYNEHVTNGIYENRNIFKTNIIEIPLEWQNYISKIRLTIDDEVDWKFCCEIFETMLNQEFSDQIKILIENSIWADTMKTQINKYLK